MRKKFLMPDYRKWLELYENGESERWIAREHAKCDVRTVKRGIEKASLERDARMVRTELLRQALRSHQKSLLELMKEILSALEPPPVDLVVLSWHAGDHSVFQEPDELKAEMLKREVTVGAKRKAEWYLLREHLKGDRLWKKLADWEQAYLDHSAARIAAQYKTVGILEEKTGYKLVDNAVPAPFIYSYTTGDIFLKAALRDAFGTPDKIDMESKIAAHAGSGEVRYGLGTSLASAPGKEDECRESLLAAYSELRLSPEISQVVDTHGMLGGLAAKAREPIEQILLLGLILGKCKICRRLGM